MAHQETADVTHEQSPETDKIVAILAWILAHPIPSLTILAAVSYLAFRVAFLIYYGRFGVTPEEVGLDYAGILTAQAAGGLLELMLVVGIALYMRVKIASIKAKLEENNRTLEQTPPEKERERVATYFKFLSGQARKLSRTATLLLMGIPLIFIILVVGDAIRSGDGARTPTITEPFQGRAIPVTALWIDSSGGAIKSRSVTYSDFGVNDYGASPPAFLLLGTREGVLVLYDKHLGAVRLPRDKILLVPPPLR